MRAIFATRDIAMAYSLEVSRQLDHSKRHWHDLKVLSDRLRIRQTPAKTKATLGKPRLNIDPVVVLNGMHRPHFLEAAIHHRCTCAVGRVEPGLL